MEAVWDMADCELDRETVAALLRGSGAPFRERSIRYLDEGWDSWAYAAEDERGRDWIVRFPKRADVVDRLAREIALLPSLAQLLPLPIPRFELFGQPGSGYPHRFVGYPMLHGIPAVEALDAPVDRGELGASLGAFLATLHSVPARIGAAAGLGEAGDSEGLDLQVERLKEQFQRFGGGLPQRALDRALALVSDAPPAPAETVLCHGDFFPEHILMAGLPSGVIDWGDVSFRDPAADIAGLCYGWGETLLAAGLARYGADRHMDRSSLEDLAARARFIAVCRGGDDLEYGTRSGRRAYAEMGARFLRML